MLWKKESLQPNAVYVDMFASGIHNFEAAMNSNLMGIVQKPHPEKSDTIALQKRNEGNDRFREGTLLDAMELYSDSLRFAKPGSEHISLAYANRSACFLKLKLYDECLIDIEYAMTAGYPESLRPKLKERKTRCLKEMQEDPLHPREKLSIEPDEKFPYLSNVAKIQQNSVKADDYSVVAKVDIDVGQLIAIEDGYHANISGAFGTKCNICLKEFSNLVPCEKCAVAMFCPECQGHFLHEYECGLNICGESDFNSATLGMVRGILLALKLFPSIDELMAFVGRMLKNPNGLPDNMLDDRSKYHTYFNSPFINKHCNRSLDEWGGTVYLTYKTLLRIPYVNGMIKSMKHRRFIMHLIGHHILSSSVTAGFFPYYRMDELRPLVHSKQLMHSYFKHSCVSNVQHFIHDGKLILFSIKPIKKGEQLLVTYGLIKESRELFMDNISITCECSRCQGKTATEEQRQQLVSDPTYRYIKSNVKGFCPLKFNGKQAKPLMDAFVKVLQRHGQMDWCKEIQFIIDWFRLLYNIRSKAGGTDFNHPLVRDLLSKCTVWEI